MNRLITLVAILSQRLLNDAFQFGWNIVVQPRDRFRLGMRDAIDRFGYRVGGERQAARGHLVEHHAK